MSDERGSPGPPKGRALRWEGEPPAEPSSPNETTGSAGVSPSPREPLPPSPKHRCVFLDRDGVLNYNRDDYVKSPEELVMLPGSAEAVARLGAAGWPVFLISNQAGIARGVMTAQDLDAVTGKVERALAAAGGALAGIYYCRHHPDDGCDCRKPQPGLLLRAAREHHLELADSYFVGDDPRDIRAGAAAGVPTILVLSGVSGVDEIRDLNPPPLHVAPDLAAAVEWILNRKAHR